MIKKLFVITSMLFVPLLVAFGIKLRLMQLEFNYSNYQVIQGLISWHAPLPKIPLQNLWLNLFYYMAPHVFIIILACFIRLRFFLIVASLILINLVLIAFSFWIYGGANVPDSPLIWLLYLPSVAVSLATCFILTRRYKKN